MHNKTQNKHYPKNKSKYRKFKKNYEQWKTTLPSFRNREGRTVKTETNKINHLLPFKSTSNITELNELIFAGVKLVSEKKGIPSKITKKESKPGWVIRLKTNIKNLRKPAEMIKEKKDAGIFWNKNENERQEKKKTIQLEEINQYALSKKKN